MKTTYAIRLISVGLLTACVHRDGTKVDLGTPESTVAGFTRAAAAGDAKLAQSYFLPGGRDYEDVWRVLTAEPGTPKYKARMMLESVDATRPFEVKSKQDTPAGTKVVWEVTFKRAFEAEGHRIQAGGHYNFDATLKKTDKGWLIDNF